MAFLIGMSVADLPAKPLGGAGARNRALAVLQKCIPLVVGNDQLGNNLALVLRIDHELREEVFFILVDAAEPIVVRHALDAGNAQNLVAIGKRDGLNDGDAIDGDQAVRRRQRPAAAEGVPHHGEKGEEEQSHRKRTEREEQANFLAKKIGENQRANFMPHLPPTTFPRTFRPPPGRPSPDGAPCARARATSGSCVTISTVLLCLLHQFLDQLHDFVGALAVQVAGGLVAKEKRGIGNDGAGDGHALLLPAGKLAREMI